MQPAIQLIILGGTSSASGSTPVTGNRILLEDGTSFLLLEDGTSKLLLES